MIRPAKPPSPALKEPAVPKAHFQLEILPQPSGYPWCRSGPVQHTTQGQMTKVPSWGSEHTAPPSHGNNRQDSSFSSFFLLSTPNAGLYGCLHKSNKLQTAIPTLSNEIHLIYQRHLLCTYIIGIIYYELTLEIILLCYLPHFHSLFIARHQQTAQRKPSIDELCVDGPASTQPHSAHTKLHPQLPQQLTAWLTAQVELPCQTTVKTVQLL